MDFNLFGQLSTTPPAVSSLLDTTGTGLRHVCILVYLKGDQNIYKNKWKKLDTLRMNRRHACKEIEQITRPCQGHFVHCRMICFGWVYDWPCNLNGFLVSARWQYHPSPLACSSKGFWLPSQFWSVLRSSPPLFFATLSSISSNWLVAQIESNTHQGVEIDPLR